MAIEDIFTNFPCIATERLILRQIQGNDADALFAMFSDEEVMKFSGGKLPHRTVEESRAFIRQLQHWYERHEGIEWGITRKGDDTVIGTCGFHSFGEGFHRAEIGYELRRAYWRQGIMSEALRAIVDPDNEQSQRILRKLGFMHEGTLRQRYFFRDHFWNEDYFGLLKDDWKEL